MSTVNLKDVGEAFANTHRTEMIKRSVRDLAARLNSDLYRVDPNAPKPAPLSRWQRLKRAVRWWVAARRERLGEIIAGRRFDDGSEW